MSLNLYTYGENNPVMYVDPTGHEVTEWDKQHLTNSEIKRLEVLGNQWANENNKGKKAKQTLLDKYHNEAEALREKYRADNEVGTSSGETITKPSPQTPTPNGAKTTTSQTQNSGSSKTTSVKVTVEKATSVKDVVSSAIGDKNKESTASKNNSNANNPGTNATVSVTVKQPEKTTKTTTNKVVDTTSNVTKKNDNSKSSNVTKGTGKTGSINWGEVANNVFQALDDFGNATMNVDIIPNGSIGPYSLIDNTFGGIIASIGKAGKTIVKAVTKSDEIIKAGDDVAKASIKIIDDVAKETVSTAGKNSVYISKAADGTVQYVGITNDIARRAAEHLASKGIQIRELMGGLSRADARAVEQTLIEINGLGKNGGTLMNKINSISKNNSAYADALKRGYELLKTAGYN